MRAAAAVITIYGLFGTSLAAAIPPPFGIPQGTAIKALEIKERYGRKSFLIDPPRPNPNFIEYVATATPPNGVCALTATTASFSEFRLAYLKQQRLQKLLSMYGKPKQLGPSARQDWLNMRPGQYPVEWKGALPNSISSIILETVGKKGSYRVELSYFYKIMNRCSSWEPDQNREGL